MPFIRYSRDKRGNETTYVMHAYRGPQGAQQTRVLYLFRSPSHVRLGRRPLDEEAREALEHTHPDLSFDWTALSREGESVRSEERHRDSRRPGRSRGTAATPAQAPVVDDQSLLGRTLGAARAARLRGRYTELVDRIGRRARTPEQRDRLIEAAQRLNPDEWPDAEAVRAHAGTIEAEWDALAAELPARRRSRRGRRRDGKGEGEAPAAGSPEAAEDGESESEEPFAEPDEHDPGSAIMASDGEVDDTQDVVGAPTPAAGGGPDGDADSHGSGTDDRRAGDDLSGDDEFRPD